jgi:hypothetical protein
LRLRGVRSFQYICFSGESLSDCEFFAAISFNPEPESTAV